MAARPPLTASDDDATTNMTNRMAMMWCSKSPASERRIVSGNPARMVKAKKHASWVCVKDEAPVLLELDPLKGRNAP